MSRKGRILFDIETIRIDEFDDLDESRKEYLLRGMKTDEEIEQAKKCVNLFPFTAEIACIAVINVDERNAGVYYRTDRTEKWSIENADNCVKVTGIDEESVDTWLLNLSKNGKLKKAEFVPCEREEDILENFWKVIECYEQFITFNGRVFDCPFVHHRSAIKKIVPTMNLITPRFKGTYPHCDLLDELTYSGATRRFNLDFYCQSFGIESPKSHGVSGYDMNELFFNQKRYEDIAKYCLGDVVATAELFLIWDTYLNPVKFKTRK
jgi:uncharacterized protein YprB with RNaseH-like and TPR domain